MATAAAPTTESFTQKTDDPDSTKQPASTKQLISPLASSVVKPANYIHPNQSKYREGWGLDAMDEFQRKPHRPPKPPQQQAATNEACNGGSRSGLSADSSKKTPRSGPWLFRCPPDCEKCSREDLQTSNSSAQPSPQNGANKNSSSKRSSSSSLSSLPSTSTSATSLSSLLNHLHIRKVESQAYERHLMTIDHSNPHIVAETSRRLERRVHDNPGKHNLGVATCAMLHATGRSKEHWEDAIAVWEDDVVEIVLDGKEGEVRKLGVTADDMLKQHRRRGLVLEGTMVESRWRKREEGWGRTESRKEGGAGK